MGAIACDAVPSVAPAWGINPLPSVIPAAWAAGDSVLANIGADALGAAEARACNPVLMGADIDETNGAPAINSPAKAVAGTVKPVPSAAPAIVAFAAAVAGPLANRNSAPLISTTRPVMHRPTRLVVG
jgi:hypothetical protein